MNTLCLARVEQLLAKARRARLLVIGDVMLDQFIWGRVTRISPEAPVPVVEFDHESYMPGGAANVARNLTSLGATVDLVGVVGRDAAGAKLRELLSRQNIGCDHLLPLASRPTSIKTRLVAHQQQVVRLDRETRNDLDAPTTARLLDAVAKRLKRADAVIVGDYGKGVVTQGLIDPLIHLCRQHAVWLSLDPKPIHRLRLQGLSLLTPNRKEAFELAGAVDQGRSVPPLEDGELMTVAVRLLRELAPALLLITLGDQGMLLCQRHQPPYHSPTAAQEVFDVSGAGDTVIASFTLAISAGASPLEATIFSNHAAGVVVGKIGTAAVRPAEVIASFQRHP